MTYIRTVLPDADTLKEMIQKLGEVTVYKRYRKYESLQGSSESVEIISQILYKHARVEKQPNP